MNLSNLLPVCFSLIAAVAIDAQDQTTTFAAARTTNYGVPLAGGSVRLAGNGSVTLPSLLFGTTTYRANASHIGTVRLFGVSAEAAAIVASYSASQTPTLQNFRLSFQRTSSAAFAVRLAGMTVLSSTSTTAGQSGNIADDVFLGDGVGYTVGLPFMNVQVRGNVTARAIYNLVPTISFTSGLGVDLVGPARVRAVGRANASASLLGATAGTTATLTYADTNANVDIHVTGGVADGTVAFTTQPIRLSLAVFGRLQLPFVPLLQSTVTLFDWSAPADSGVLQLTQQ